MWLVQLNIVLSFKNKHCSKEFSDSFLQHTTTMEECIKIKIFSNANKLNEIIHEKLKWEMNQMMA